MSISVIIPCYQCKDTIGRAINSVAAQSLLPQEVILVDDGSSNDTLATLKALQNNYNDDWIKIIAFDQNQGPGVARNAGWDLASSEFIAFLDADDSWHPKKLETQYQLLKQHDELLGLGHKVAILPEGAQRDVIADGLNESDITVVPFSSLIHANQFVTSTMMLRRDCDLRFASEKYFSEDYLLWLKLTAGGSKLANFNLALAYRFNPTFGGDGLSGNIMNMQLGQLDNYRQLYRAGYLSWWQWLRLSAVSWVNFAKRCLLLAHRRLRKKLR